MSESKIKDQLLLQAIVSKILPLPKFSIISRQEIKGEGATTVYYFLLGIIPLFTSVSVFDQYQL